MGRFRILLLPVLLISSCKKEEAKPENPPIVVEPVSKGNGAQPEPETPKAKKKESPKIKYAPIDLRDYRLFAVVDAPEGTTVNDVLGVSLDAGPLRVSMNPASRNDLAKEKERWQKDAEFKFKSFHVDEPNALLAEGETSSGKPFFRFAANITVGSEPVFVYSNNFESDPEMAGRHLAWARTLRQTSELKQAQERQNSALEELKRLGAAISLVLKPKVEFSKVPEIDMKLFDLLQAIPALDSVSFLDCGKFPPGGLSSLSKFGNLKTVRIIGGGLKSQQVSELRGMTTLEALTLNGAPIDDVAFRSLEDLSGLHKLDLNYTRITDNGLRYLRKLKQLESLSLRGTDVAGPGFIHLKECPMLSSVDLADSAVSDATMKGLSALPALKYLSLADTVVSDSGLDTLATLSKLSEINLFGTNVTSERASKFGKDVKVFLEIDPNTKKQEAELAPKPVEPPVPIAKLPPADAVVLVAAHGGKIVRDENADGKPIIEVHLNDTKVSDADLGMLRDTAKLRVLKLDGCAQITDAGLAYLAGLKSLEELSLRGTKVKGDGFAHLSNLKRLTKLFLSPETVLSSGQLKFLAALPDLEIVSFTVSEPAYPKLRILSGMVRLKDLNLGGVTMNNRKMDFLKGMKNLDTIALGRSGTFSNRGLIPLKGLPELKTLVIPNYLGSDSGLEHLKAMMGLKSLELYGPFITDRGISALNGLNNLERLRLDRLNIGDGAFSALRGLKVIELSAVQTGITDRGLDSLAEIAELEFADLSFTKVTDAGLAKFKNMQELRGLRLEGTTINGSGFKSLDQLPRLHRLLLRETKLNDDGLAAIGRLNNLMTLDVSKNTLTSAGVAKLKGLRMLQEINLTDCMQVNDDVIPAFKEFFGLKQLVLKGTKLTPKGIEDLRKANIEVIR